MSDPTPRLSPQPSDEFFIRVNDFIEMANRIERRFDTAHAQFAMLHAFTRYGAHHYRRTVKADGAEERLAYANYLGGAVANMVMEHIEQLAGPAAAADPAGADEPAAE